TGQQAQVVEDDADEADTEEGQDKDRHPAGATAVLAGDGGGVAPASGGGNTPAVACTRSRPPGRTTLGRDSTGCVLGLPGHAPDVRAPWSALPCGRAPDT